MNHREGPMYRTCVFRTKVTIYFIPWSGCECSITAVLNCWFSVVSKKTQKCKKGCARYEKFAFPFLSRIICEQTKVATLGPGFP